MTTTSVGPLHCVRKLSAASLIAGGREESSLMSRFSHTLGIMATNDWEVPGAGGSNHKSPVCWQKVQAHCSHIAGHQGPGVDPEGSEAPSGLHWCSVRWAVCHHLICQTCTTPFQQKSPVTWRGWQWAVQINKDLHCWLP